MVINRLLISCQHRRYNWINKSGDAISLYNRHSNYIYRQPSKWFSLSTVKGEQMFDRLATSANKPSASGEKQPIRIPIRVTSLQNCSGNTQKEFDKTFSHPMLCATTRWTKMFDRLAGALVYTLYLLNVCRPVHSSSSESGKESLVQRRRRTHQRQLGKKTDYSHSKEHDLFPRGWNECNYCDRCPHPGRSKTEPNRRRVCPQLGTLPVVCPL